MVKLIQNLHAQLAALRAQGCREETMVCRALSPVSWLFTQPFFQTQIKQNIKAPRHWPLCGEFLPGTGEFPAQMASNAENVSIWWRHHSTIEIKQNKTAVENLCEPEFSLGITSAKNISIG